MPIPEHAQPESVEALVAALAAAMKKLGPELNALNRMNRSGYDALILSARFIATAEGRDVTATRGADFAPRRAYVEASDAMHWHLRAAIESLSVMREQARKMLALEQEAAQKARRSVRS